MHLIRLRSKPVLAMARGELLTAAVTVTKHIYIISLLSTFSYVASITGGSSEARLRTETLSNTRLERGRWSAIVLDVISTPKLARGS